MVVLAGGVSYQRYPPKLESPLIFRPAGTCRSEVISVGRYDSLLVAVLVGGLTLIPKDSTT